MDILSQNHWEFKQSSPNSLLKTLPKPQSWKTLYYRVHTIVKTKLVETIGSFLILSHSSNAYEMDKSDYPPTAGWETIYPTPQNTNTFECSCSEQILEVLYFFRFSGFFVWGVFLFYFLRPVGSWVKNILHVKSLLCHSLKTLLSSLNRKVICSTSDPKFFLGNKKPFLKFIKTSSSLQEVLVSNTQSFLVSRQ